MHKFPNVSAIPKPSHVLPTPVQQNLGQWQATATSNPCPPDATAADLVLGHGEVTTKQPRPLEHRCIALASTLAPEPAPPPFQKERADEFPRGAVQLTDNIYPLCGDIRAHRRCRRWDGRQGSEKETIHRRTNRRVT